MKRNYTAPSIKVKQVDNESIMAASPGVLTPNGDGTETQTGVDPSNPGKTVDGGEALGKGNIWNNWDE